MSEPSVKECRERLRTAVGDELTALIQSLHRDTRQGVRDAVLAARRRIDKERSEIERLEGLSCLEDQLRAQGATHIAGVDEVGRGALAGPLTAAAVILPAGARVQGLDDSKRLTHAKRLVVSERIRSVAVAYAVAHLPAHIIDAVGMTEALRLVMERALASLHPGADHVVSDGLRIGLSVTETPVVGGDAKVAAVAAASVLAKVTRDAMMTAYDTAYPGWDFAITKGYGTAQHLDAIAISGLTPIHRRSFGPCRQESTLF